MMCAVIEELHHQCPARPPYLRLDGPGKPTEFASQIRIGNHCRPVEDGLVCFLAHPSQRKPVTDQVYRSRDVGLLRRRCPRQPVHPELISPQQVVQCGVDGAEKGAPVLPAFRIGE